MSSKMPSFSSSISLLPLVLFVFYPLIQGEGYGRHQTRDLTGTDPSALNCSSSNSGAGKASLGLYHRYGPCARPLQDYTMPSLQEVRLHDKLRIQSLMKKQGSEEVSVNGRAALEIPNRMYGAAGIYVVEIGLGTPAVPQLVNFDTGSELTWVQCSPCQICLPQDPNYPIFAGKSSRTYRSVPCNDPRCPSPGTVDYNCSTTGTCTYSIGYGDKSTSAGELATDRLTFATTGNSLQDFVFGCGTNQYVSNGKQTLDSGMLGLSRSPVSIVNQTLLSFAGVFSYCLPASRQSTGHLTFGVSENVVYQYVPMVASPTGLPDLYFVNLMGIGVGGIALQIPETEFLTPGGTIIDSGTTLTSIPQSAYKLLRETFITQVSNLNPGVVTEDGTPCYKSSDLSQMNIPNITLVISQVAVPLKATRIFLQVADDKYCLAFQANEKPQEEPNIIGYVNQRQLEVVYDIVNQRIGFADGTC